MTRAAISLVCLLLSASAGCGANAGPAPDLAMTDATALGGDGGTNESPAVSDGLGTKAGGGTGMCTPTEDRYIDGDYGTVTARDGRVFAVPGPIRAGGIACTDLYNPCAGGANPGWQSQLKTIVIDDTPDAVEVTGYLYGDNYFELYVNGKYVCRDALTFVPFNAHVVRFKARYPMTIAVEAVDWEQMLGAGIEIKNNANHVGDGGLAARFVDSKGRVIPTSTDWKCRPYYIAPVDDPACVKADRDSAACPPAACAAGDPKTCHAVLWDVPPDWTGPGFDDASWPAASKYAPAAVNPKPAYTNNAALFQGVDFIWSKNLTIDNLVLCRRTIAP